MTILSSLPSSDVSCDVCIIGTGPVGLALALECERNGISVLALEAGGASEQTFGAKGSLDAELADPARHVPLEVGAKSGFGGTTWAWSGACVPFDPLDFRARHHVPHASWPLQHRDIGPYYAAAADFLDCRKDDVSQAEHAWNLEGGVSADNVVLYSQTPKLAAKYQQHFERSQTITVCLNSPVVDLKLSKAGDRVQSVIVAARGRTWTLSPPRVVIAAGGLRSTQLLLSLQRLWPKHFGGLDGPLGRYYMGHLTGWISTIQFTARDAVEYFEPKAIGDRSFARRRFTITESVQLSQRLFNTVFWPSHVYFADPSHCSGPLSSFFLATAVPIFGSWLLPKEARRTLLESAPKQITKHLRNILAQPGTTALVAAQALFNRVTRGTARSAVARGVHTERYLLQYHAEHAPNPASRVTLLEKRDKLGLPAMRIDLRFDEADAESIVRSHETLARALNASGRATLTYIAPFEKRLASVLEQATDGYHQIGTTRMGDDPRASVVDRNCKVHDLDNLHVVSSSVFSSSSHANPTLLATALALRLARHLATSMGSETSIYRRSQAR